MKNDDDAGTGDLLNAFTAHPFFGFITLRLDADVLLTRIDDWSNALTILIIYFMGQIQACVYVLARPDERSNRIMTRLDC